jgi:ATP synthase F1 complex assembly factor 1
MMIQTLTTRLAKRQLFSPSVAFRRQFSFSFVGPKTLHEILKKDLVQDKTRTEISDMWYTYHENKVIVYEKRKRKLDDRSSFSNQKLFYILLFFHK